MDSPPEHSPEAAATAKKELRARMRGLLRDLPEEARRAFSARMLTHLLESAAWANVAGPVLLFLPLPGEPDLSGLWSTAFGKTLVLPRISANGALSLHTTPSPDACLPGPHGLQEPDPARCPEIPVTEISLLLVPGLAFDKQGSRLGRGRGFYDRLLAGLHPQAHTIGICFQLQVTSKVPRETHDINVHGLLTENGPVPTGS